MIYKKVSRIEKKISAIGIGCWPFSGPGVWDQYSDENSINTIHAAIDQGVNFFDVAPVYGRGYAESILGKALKKYVNREEIVIASKCGLTWDPENPKEVFNDLTAKSLHQEIDRSLNRLQLDYIDIYQLHWPDTKTPLAETMGALNEMKKQGKIRHIAVSNFTMAQIKEAQRYAELDSYQGLYNLLEKNPSSYHGIELGYRTQDEILPYCRANGMAFLPYSPLMQGVLTGCFQRDNNFSANDIRTENPKLCGTAFYPYFDIVEELKAYGKAIDRTVLEIAFNWLVQNDAVTCVISGATTVEQITANVRTLSRPLSADQLAKVDAIVAPLNE